MSIHKHPNWLHKKKGPWSQQEREFIAQNHEKMLPAEIARRLGRSVDTVQQFIEKNLSTQFIQLARGAEYNIKASPVWADLEKQFSPDELDMFLYHWGRIISQFKDDVFPTEELQVVDVIKLELLMNRMQTQNRDVITKIKELEEDIKAEKSKDLVDQNRDYLFNLERQVAGLRAAQEAVNKDYLEMLNKKNLILKEMKATRDQRIKNVESSKTSYVAWMQQLLADNDLRMRLGVQAEKMRLAKEVELERLSDYHTYIDGQLDQPMLTPDTIKD